MNVAELIDILQDLDPETIVEMAIVAPVTDQSEDITVDQYEVEGVLPRDPDDHNGEMVVWLIGGESQDVDEFVDAIEGTSEDLQTGQQADIIEIERGVAARRAIFGA